MKLAHYLAAAAGSLPARERFGQFWRQQPFSMPGRVPLKSTLRALPREKSTRTGVRWQYNNSRGNPVAISRPDQLRNRRFQLRATASEEKLIKVAADRQGVNVTEFILRSAREKAEQSLADQTRFVLDDKRWRAFMAALDRPAQDKPRLRRLFREGHVAKRRS